MYYGRIYTQAFIRQLRERYPEGTRVELVSMEDPYNTKLKPGDQGTVTYIDAQGTIFIDWDVTTRYHELNRRVLLPKPCDGS